MSQYDHLPPQFRPHPAKKGAGGSVGAAPPRPAPQARPASRPPSPLPPVAPAGPQRPAALSPDPSPRRLRERWPFLDDPECPPELHALTGHRISKYNEYVRLHPRLRDCQTAEDCALVAGQLLDAYEDNRLCTQELDYYQEHRRLLGRHHLLRHFASLRELRQLSTKQLLKEQRKVRDNIWRVGSEIRKGDKPHLLGQRTQKLQEYELKLKEINRLLDE